MATVNSWTWTINSLYTTQTPQPGYVANAFWTLTGTDGIKTASVSRDTVFLESQSDPDFIPYANLTPEIVIGWVQNSLGADGIAYFENEVQSQIDAEETTTPAPTPTPVPW